jgi:hypothetical protein
MPFKDGTFSSCSYLSCFSGLRNGHVTGIVACHWTTRSKTSHSRYGRLMLWHEAIAMRLAERNHSFELCYCRWGFGRHPRHWAGRFGNLTAAQPQYLSSSTPEHSCFCLQSLWCFNVEHFPSMLSFTASMRRAVANTANIFLRLQTIC